MQAAGSVQQMARYVAPLLPFVLAGPPYATDGGALTLVNPAVARVVVAELRRLVDEDPELRRVSVPASAGEQPAVDSSAVDSSAVDSSAVDSSAVDLSAVEKHLADRFCNGAKPTFELLWTLLTSAGALPPVRDAAPSTPVAVPFVSHPLTWIWLRVVKGVRNPWVLQQAVAAALNLEIAVIVAVAVLYGRPFTWHTAANLGGLGPLRLFSVWALSFLPAWLFVRFLSQRAGALWLEFVVALHRLGVTDPQFLPPPPLASGFHQRWLQHGGPLYSQTLNLYQEKFDAYYGKSVSRATSAQGARVRTETLFPVFLLTAILAAGWTAVLWDTGFLDSASGEPDILKYAFLGAYAFIAQMLTRRFFQSDLKASAYTAAALRIILVLILVSAVSQLPAVSLQGSTAAIVAFVVGFFPLVGMRALQAFAATTLRLAIPSLSPAYPLNQIDGLNIWYEARLVEEGIEDMQNLTTADLVDVILHAHVPVGRLVDWVDQAHLYQHLDRTEISVLERRASRRGPKRGKEAGSPREGSVYRHAFRMLGIRNATDLLKAVPPASRTVEGLAWVKDFHLEPRMVLSLVTVLSKEPGLAPIQRWQACNAGNDG